MIDLFRKSPKQTARKVALACLLGATPAMALQAPSPASVESLPGANVEGLLVLVKNYNPNLAAAALDAEEAAAKIYPAGALDDPMVNFSRDQAFRQTILSVSQDFSLWGKRGLKTGVAEANTRSARARQGSVQRELEEQ